MPPLIIIAELFVSTTQTRRVRTTPASSTNINSIIGINNNDSNKDTTHHQSGGKRSHMTLVWTMASMLATSVDPQRVSWKMKPVGGVIGTLLSASIRWVVESRESKGGRGGLSSIIAGTTYSGVLKSTQEESTIPFRTTSFHGTLDHTVE